MHKGDLQRVVISLTPVDYDREIVVLKDKAEKSYRRAYEICVRIDDLSDIKAGIILHYSVYIFEENKDYERAYQIANKFYEKAKKLLSKIKNSNETHLELINIMTIMKQNIDVWKNKIDNAPYEQEEEENIDKKSKDNEKEKV